jgi:transposase
MVNRALVREFKYEYAAVSPWDGSLDYMTAPRMKGEDMSRFLAQVSDAHKDNFMVMVLDGAPSHKSKDLKVPENVALIPLPPYSPELNPVELLWNTLRRDYFANRVFDSLEAAVRQAEKGLADIASNSEQVKRLTNWPWINVILNAR